MANEKQLMYVDDFKKNMCSYCNLYLSEEPCEPNECWVCDVIAQTDTVDAVEVVHGRWFAHHSHSYECTCCHAKYITMRAKDWNYCPNCGAKMDGDGNG